MACRKARVVVTLNVLIVSVLVGTLDSTTKNAFDRLHLKGIGLSQGQVVKSGTLRVLQLVLEVTEVTVGAHGVFSETRFDLHGQLLHGSIGVLSDYGNVIL